MHPNAPIPRAAEAHEEEVLLFRDGGPFTAISRYTLCGNFLTSLRKSGLDIREIFNNIRSFVANIWQIRTRSFFRPIISPTLFPFLFLPCFPSVKIDRAGINLINRLSGDIFFNFLPTLERINPLYVELEKRSKKNWNFGKEEKKESGTGRWSQASRRFENLNIIRMVTSSWNKCGKISTCCRDSWNSRKGEVSLFSPRIL